MAKITLPDVSNILGNPTSAANTINANNSLIEGEFENTLSRDGSTPNQMLADIDMNNNDIIGADTVNTAVLKIAGVTVVPSSAVNASNFATAAQGAKADTALQPAAIGTTVQAFDTDLTAIAGLTSAADQLPYATGTDTWAMTTLTSYGRSLVDDVDATAARTTLGLGTMATQAASGVAITGGSVTGITDLAVADGGTGASTASAARTNLGLAIGTDVQAYRLSGSATYDPPSLADGAGATTTVTVTGAALGDFAVPSFSLSTQGITVTANVTSANTVTVRFQNETGGTIDLASGTLACAVFK